jgi:hypothetical protein
LSSFRYNAAVYGTSGVGSWFQSIMVTSSSSSSLPALRLLETGGCRPWTTAWICCLLPTNESTENFHIFIFCRYIRLGRKKSFLSPSSSVLGIAYRLLVAPAGSCCCCCRRMMIDDAEFLLELELRDSIHPRDAISHPSSGRRCCFFFFLVAEIDDVTTGE